MPSLMGSRKAILLRRPALVAAAPAWTPADLFASGEEGFFVDFTTANLQTTIGGGGGSPGSGGNIGYALDLSGNDNHFTSSTGKVPTYNATKQAATFAGGQELHSVANPVVWNTSGNHNATVIVGCEKSSAINGQILLEMGAVYTTVNHMGCLMTDEPSDGANAFGFNAHHYTATGSGFSREAVNSLTDGNYHHLRMTMDGNSPSTREQLMPIAEVNGVDPGSRDNVSTPYAGTNTMDNAQWFVGARNASSVFYTGNICYIFAIDRFLTTDENNEMEAWAMTRMGISF